MNVTRLLCILKKILGLLTVTLIIIVKLDVYVLLVCVGKSYITLTSFVDIIHILDFFQKNKL